MNTMPMTTRTIASIPACWVYQDRTYTYVEKGRTVELLPTVSAEYKSLLDELKIPHRPISSGLKYEFWDPACYSEKKCTLPLYLRTDGQYRYIKNHTASVVTNEMQSAAFALNEALVKPEITRLKKEQEKKALISRLKLYLNDRPACGVSRYADTLFKSIPDEGIDITMADDHIRVFRVHTLMSEARKARIVDQYWDYCGTELELSPKACRLDTEYLAVFDVTKCKPSFPLTIEVPAQTEGIFVGRQGWQVKEWCEQLGGILKITVKGV